MVTKKATKKKEAVKYFYGLGRRKRSNVRAKYFPVGSGIEIIVDGKKAAEYFPLFYRQTIENLLSSAGVKSGEFHLFARGGGISGQAEAARLAIAKALVAFDSSLKPVLKTHGYLTTDVRKVLPKRPGKRKARKSEQWSKR